MSKKCYWYKAKVTRVVDGDTIDLEIDLGFETFTKKRIRLANVDAPERRKDKEGWTKAKVFVEDTVKKYGPDVLVNTKKGKGKWGRWISPVYFGRRSLGSMLCRKRLAKRLNKKLK